MIKHNSLLAQLWTQRRCSCMKGGLWRSLVEEERATKVDGKMKTCFAAGCWGLRVVLWESSHVQVAKEPRLEFSGLVGAKPDPDQQLCLFASDDCSSEQPPRLVGLFPCPTLV